MNTLYYGDNLGILREHIPSESVDLIYLDPRSNEGRKDDAEKDRWEALPTDAVGDIWAENPAYPRSDWNREASNNETSLGYWDWVANQKEMQK